MAIYERTLVSGKVDRIDTEKNFIDPTTQSLLAENQQQAKKMIERHRAENPNNKAVLIIVLTNRTWLTLIAFAAISLPEYRLSDMVDEKL